MILLTPRLVWAIDILAQALHTPPLGVICLVASVVFSPSALPAPPTIPILYNGQSKSQQNVVDALKRQKRIAHDYRSEFIDIANAPPDFSSNRQSPLIITLGRQAALIANQTKALTLNTMLAKQQLSEARLCILASCADSGSHYAIYLDQPIARQLNLLKLIFPHFKTVGVLTADFSSAKLGVLAREAQKRQLTLNNRTIHAASELNQQYDELVISSDVILALPDPLIHNRETVPYLLLTSYRYNVPVIAFSEAYVKAGAVAAVYSTPQQIGLQIRELSEQLLSNAQPFSQHILPPKYFTVSINRNVGRSLEIRLPETEQLKLQLLRLEK